MPTPNDLPVTTMKGEELEVIETTGEIVKLEDASTAAIASWLRAYSDAQDAFKEAKRAIDAEMAKRADFDAAYHFDVEGIGRITVTGPNAEAVWDVEKLRGVLQDLVTAGEIAPVAANACVEEVTTYKVKLTGINALIKLGGYVSKSVQSCRELHEPTRRASLRRTGPS